MLPFTCLAPRPQYFPRSFVSGHMVRAKSMATPGRSSGIRHRNQLTAKAWEKAVKKLETRFQTEKTRFKTKTQGNLEMTYYNILSIVLEEHKASVFFCKDLAALDPY